MHFDRHSRETLSMECEEDEVETSDNASHVSEQRSVMSSLSFVMRRIELERKNTKLRNLEELSILRPVNLNF